MKKKSKTLAVFGLILFFYLMFWQNIYLEIINKSSVEIKHFSFSREANFSIEYLHSYDKAMVKETFGADHQLRIIPKEVIYSADTYDLRDTRYPGSDIDISKDYIKISNINEQDNFFEKIFINIKHFEPQYLTIIDGDIVLDSYSFLNLGDKGDLLKIEIVKRSFFNKIYLEILISLIRTFS